nr:hypothetical protein [Tanacetum cinerariifolium]
MDQNIDFLGFDRIQTPLKSSNSNQEKEEPSQDSDIRQLIREECCVEASEEQKQNMEDTMLELVKICQEKELLCIHDNVDDLIESAVKSKLLLINLNSQLATILSTKEPEYSSSMGYENLNTTLEIETDEIIKSGVEELVPILSENEVTLEDKRECDIFVCENSPICDDHSDIFYDSKIDDDISVYDDDFEDIEYVEASLSNPEIVSGVEEENVVQQAENVVQQEEEEKRREVVTLLMLMTLFSKESDLFIAFDNSIPPSIENFANDSEGDIRFLEELLIDDSILSHESSDSNFEDNPSIP